MLLFSALFAASCAAPGPTQAPTGSPARTPAGEPAAAPTLDQIIPRPVSVTAGEGTFSLTPEMNVYVEPGTAELTGIGQYLADRLRPATGYGMQALTATETPAQGNILLTTVGGDAALGEEGYELTIRPDSVTLVAHQPAGLFRGVQTIRQLLPPSIESATAQPGPWPMASGTIRDYPRYAWRGAMLDVARHFFGVADVKRTIDLLAYYKMNRLHLHLADDQGWRIEINSWPRLAEYGGSTEVGGGPGGYYTQEEYADIVTYAESRYITIVPEIDTPGHTNAALASYAELNCTGEAPALYTGTNVGFSSLCANKEITYRFLEDVVREIAALTPGPYFHIGGDEAAATNETDYLQFVERFQRIVQAQGKQMVGWEEIAKAHLLPTTIVQYWHGQAAQRIVQQGAQVIMSPASKTYVDMKYDGSTPLGLNWAGMIEVQDGYEWEPAEVLSGLPASNVLGVEAPLWTETIQTMDDIEFMVFPRMPGYAEIGWSPAGGRAWNEYRVRLAAHGPRLAAMGVNFYRSPQVPWP